MKLKLESSSESSSDDNNNEIDKKIDAQALASST